MHVRFLTAPLVVALAGVAIASTGPDDAGLTVTVDNVTIDTDAPAGTPTTVTLPDGRTVTVTVEGQPLDHADAHRRRVVEIVFVLDTTGSMAALIEGAKQRIWTIASHAQQRRGNPEIRIGLVGYRDRGDAYVTRVTPLTADIDAVYADLMRFDAAGGGDMPESVNAALSDAFGRVGWSRDERTTRVVYLVGDAPPKDYANETHYSVSVPSARERGITVHAVQCGGIHETEGHRRSIASLGGGAYTRVDQSGGVDVVPTPFDEQLARLNTEITATIVPYGDAREAEATEMRLEEMADFDMSAPVSANADRAAFRIANADVMFGGVDLVTKLTTGEETLDSYDPALVRGDLAGLDPEAQRARVAELLERRRAAEAELLDLSAQRAAWLRDNAEAFGAGDGFDDFVARTLGADEDNDDGE
ncbi:MAG: vWA domain-containing protein [Planctomycetota bacterium]